MMSLLEAIPPTSRALLQPRDGGTTRERVFALLKTDVDTMNAAIVGGGLENDDWKLKHLTVKAGQLAAFIHDDGWARNHLRRIFGFSYGWLQSLGGRNTLAKINAERDRQDKLFVEGKHLFSCASSVVDDHRKLRALIEEIGEVAKAIDAIERATTAHQATLQKHLRLEIVQVAAVAVAWLESPNKLTGGNGVNRVSATSAASCSKH